MKLRSAASLTFLILFCLGAAPSRVEAQQGVPFKGDRVATLMTWNVYHGVDAQIFDVLTAGSPQELALQIAAVYAGYGATNFPDRAEAIAAQIAEVGPELVGLQEAILVRTQFPPDGPLTPAQDVAIDVVALILDALAARGLDYDLVVDAVGFEAELPSPLNGFDIRHTNRDVILARSDLKTADLKLSNPMSGEFQFNCVFPTDLIGPVVITRAWASIDAKIRGKSFRFLSTHLESACGAATIPVRMAQMEELLAAPGRTPLPLVLVGDLNSPAPGGAVYNTLLGRGFKDAFGQVGLGTGYTCCQFPDLMNGPSLLSSRLDYILYRGAWEARSAETVGDVPEDKTSGIFPLWASDHAGVAADLVIPYR